MDRFNAGSTLALGIQETLRDQVSKHLLSAHINLEDKDLRTQGSPSPPLLLGLEEQKQDMRLSPSW